MAVKASAQKNGWETLVMTPQGGWRLAALAYSSALLLLLFPLLSHAVDPMWDAFDMGYPAFAYLADSLREGRFPLWDPYTNCGFPFHADPVGTMLSPVAIFFGVLLKSASLGFNWFWVFYWWLGGFGMLWLARHYGAAPVGAFVAAISYALSGFFLAHAEHTGFIVIAACLPWIWLCAERAVMFSSVGDALLAGAALGFSAYGGYSGLVLFSCLAVAIWLALRFLPASIVADTDLRPATLRLRWIGITLAIMAVVYVVVWSPALHAFWVEGRGYTDRVNPLDVERATRNMPFTFAAALSLFFPYVTFTGGAWMGTDISMSNAYMGMLTVPLAIFWIGKSGWRRSWWIILFVLFMFVLSLGGEYGLRTLLYYVYYPSRFMQFNAPFRLFWIFPLCLVAGLGLTRLIRHPEERQALLRIVLGWGLGALGAAILFVVASNKLGIPYARDFSRLFAPGTVILVLSVALLYFWGKKPDVRAARLIPMLLAVLILSDMSIHLYNNAGTVWNKVTTTKEVEEYHQRSTGVNGAPPARLPGRPYGYFNAQQVIKRPLVQGYVTMKSEGFDEILVRSRFVEVLSAPDRFWLSPGVETVASKDESLAILAATGANMPVPVLVEEPIAGLGSGRVVPGSFGFVEIRSYAPEHIEMNVAVPGATGAFLASTERYTPGWKAYVDGRPQPAQKVNLFFRGIYLPAGQHTVVWRYEPKGWVALVWVSYLTLIAASVAGGVMLWMKKKRAAAEVCLRLSAKAK